MQFLQDVNAMCPICGIKLYILHLCDILWLCLYCIDCIDCRRGRARTNAGHDVGIEDLYSVVNKENDSDDEGMRN